MNRNNVDTKFVYTYKVSMQPSRPDVNIKQQE